MGGYEHGIADTLNPALQILRDMKKDVRETKGTVDVINRELGGVQAMLRTMERNSEEQDKKIDLIRSEQLSCPARTGYPSVRSTIQKLEGEIDSAKETTGVFRLIPHEQVGGLPFKDLVVKAMPYLILSFVCGAGLLSILIFKLFFNK